MKTNGKLHEPLEKTTVHPNRVVLFFVCSVNLSQTDGE